MTDWLPFSEAVKDITGGNKKIQVKDYLENGKIPVVDQGKSLIGGFTDQPNAASSVEGACVIFGDHTRIIKFINFPFALGADGVKILVPRVQDIDVKFLYFYLKSLQIPNEGYSRLFKFLKEVRVPRPAPSEQSRIVSMLDRAEKIRIQAEAAVSKAGMITAALTSELFRSLE